MHPGYICPACGYKRNADEEHPDWQCPNCERAYSKVEAYREAEKARRKLEADAPRHPNPVAPADPEREASSRASQVGDQAKKFFRRLWSWIVALNIPGRITNELALLAEIRLSKRTKSRLLGVVAVVFAVSFIAVEMADMPVSSTSTSNQSARVSKQPSQTTPSPRPTRMVAPISSIALTPYSPETHPTIYERYGHKINQVERLRKKAAELAAQNPRCDKVMHSNVSMDDKIREHALFIVVCANQERFNLTADKIQRGSAARSVSEDGVPNWKAVSTCKELIKSRANNPSTVKTRWLLGTDAKMDPVTGDSRVSIDFSAANSFGVRANYHARCYVPKRGPPTIRITERP